LGWTKSWSTSTKHGSKYAKSLQDTEAMEAITVEDAKASVQKIAVGNTGSSGLQNQWELGWKGTNSELERDKTRWQRIAAKQWEQPM
jgi:hypothetical protein